MAPRVDLGVGWHLPWPDGNGFYKRPFASTTRASADIIEDLAERGKTWAQIGQVIRFDPEAWTVAQRFVEAGFGDVPAARHIWKD